MKLLYYTPNITQHANHIKQITANDYNIKHGDYEATECDKHCNFIFRLHKKRHRNIISDMFNVLVMKSVGIEIIETINYYYINISLGDYNRIKRHEFDNLFISKLNKLIHPLLYFNKQHRIIFNTTRMDEEIPFNSNWNFNVLDDLRYMSIDYMNILWKNELDRKEMNKLFKLTLWLKLPVHSAMELMRDFPIVSGNNCHNKNNPQFDSNAPEKKIHLRLSDIGKSDEINNDNVFIDVSPKDIMYTTKYMYIDMLQKNHPDINILSMYTLTDTFVTLSIETLSNFVSPTYLKNKSYQPYLHGVAEMLLFNDNNMDFIFNGKDKYL